MQATLALLLLVFSLATTDAFAQNKLTRANYKEARSLYLEMDKTVSGALLWEKKKFAERGIAIKAAMANRDKIQKLWGDLSACSAAAVFHVEFVGELNSIVSAGEGLGTRNSFQLLGAMHSADQFGKHRSACFEEVEALDIALKK